MTTPDARRADLAALGLRLDEDAAHATLPVTPRLCTPFGFLYGGTGIAACAAAAEAVTGRPLVWVTTQFVDNAFAGEQVDLDVTVVAAGRATSQTQVRATVGDRVVLLAATAHTDRPEAEVVHWGAMPAVPDPEACVPFRFPFPPRLGTSFMDDLDRRVPAVQPGLAEGRVAMWVRVPGWPVWSPAAMAFVADIVPMAVNEALGREPGGTSLDNTLRVVRAGRPGGGWVLLDIEAQGFGRSIGHGQVRVWSPEGDLLAVGSQSCIIRTSHHDRPLPGGS